MKNHHRRLVEDYLPVEAISEKAGRDKSIRKGPISTPHLWWTRRPAMSLAKPLNSA